MKAILCHRLSDDFSGLALGDFELPSIEPDEVRVRMRAASVNFPDILMTQGKYQAKPPLPFTPGMEGAGEVLEVGTGVSHLSPGDRVAVGLGVGGFAEEAIAKGSAARKIPDDMDFTVAAACRAAYLTAYVALVRKANLQAGETLLVHGAAGGVGLAAVDVGKLLGAKVIATASSVEKMDLLKDRGADLVLDVTEGFRVPVKEATGGKGADVVFDPVGGDVFDESTRCIAFDGRLLVVGFAGGRIAEVPTNIPLIKGFSVIGVRAGEYGRQFPERGRENIEIVDQWLAEKKIAPHIGATFDLNHAVDAMKLLADRKAIGKVVIMID